METATLVQGRSTRKASNNAAADAAQSLDYQIAFFTNTYLPFIGGVARSTSLYQKYLSRLGAQVIVYAPRYEGAEEDGDEVRRLPSIRNFYKSDFSLPIPVSFKPTIDFGEASFDIVHVHHPFLLGETGMHMARQYRIPLVFTYHTQYEMYTHYVPISDELAGKTIIRHTKEFCDYCDLVIAPTEDVKRVLLERGVNAQIEVLSTGIETELYKGADRQAIRRSLNMKRGDLLLIHVGRLTKEKNLEYLMRANLRALTADSRLHFAIVGDGDFRPMLEQMATEAGEPGSRVHFIGRLQGQELINAYSSADLFVFASKTETQGMVVAEAMAGGTPAIALDADGVRHLIRDQSNGLLLDSTASDDDFAQGILHAVDNRDQLKGWSRAARKTAQGMDMSVQAERLLQLYRSLKSMPNRRRKTQTMSFGLIRNYFETVWEQVENWISRI